MFIKLQTKQVGIHLKLVTHSIQSNEKRIMRKTILPDHPLKTSNLRLRYLDEKNHRRRKDGETQMYSIQNNEKQRMRKTILPEELV